MTFGVRRSLNCICSGQWNVLPCVVRAFAEFDLRRADGSAQKVADSKWNVFLSAAMVVEMYHIDATVVCRLVDALAQLCTLFQVDTVHSVLATVEGD